MENPDPYRTPQAPVDPQADAATLQSVRVLLRALVVAQIALIPVVLMLPDTLPPELKRLRDEHDMVFFNTHGALALAAIGLLIAALVGLWWERRWAAWAYVVANGIGYALQLASGARISSDLASMADSFADAAIGATLVVLYLGGFFAQPRDSSP